MTSDPAPSGWGLPVEQVPAATGRLGVDEAERYVAAGLLGAGGLGVVEAVHDRRLDREVARKRPAPHLDPDLAVALLEHEARVTARLDHPNVVPVHDAGVDADGVRFFTMRLVRGRTLAELLAEPRGPADLPRLLRPVLDAARALAHAHAHGIVHADLKPANVLVGPHGEVQVTDWGLARFVGPADQAEPAPAPRGAGTPPWRAPEVEAGAPPSPAADVHALGVVLREVLSGDPARDPADGPVDLRAVLRRATAPDPADRYPDAGALADDLARWLDGRPVLAHAYTPAQMVRRLVAAWRVPLAVTAAAAVALVAVSATAWVRTVEQRDRAVAAEARLAATAATLWASRAASALARDDRPEAERAAREALALAPGHPEAAGVLAAFGAPPPAVRAGTAPLPEHGEVLRLDGRGALVAIGGKLVRVGPDGGAVEAWDVAATDAVPRPDGRVVVLAGARLEVLGSDGRRQTLRGHAGTTGLVDGGDGAWVDRLALHDLGASGAVERPCPDRATVDAAALDGAGGWWATCSDGRLARGRFGEGGVELRRDPELAGVVALAWAGDRLLAGRLDGRLLTLDAADGAVLARLDTPLAEVRRVRPSPDGRLAVAIDARAQAWLWRPEDGVGLGRLDAAPTRDAAWDGPTTLRLAGDALEAWTVAADPAPSRWREQGGIGTLALAPDGDRLAVAAGSTILLRALPTARLAHRLDHHARTVKGLVFDGARLGSAAVDEVGALAWTDVVTGAPDADPSLRALHRLVRTGDGHHVVAVYAPRLLVAPAPDAPLRDLPLPRQASDLVACPGARDAWTLDADGRVHRVVPAEHRADEVLVAPGALRLACAADGGRLALAYEAEVRLLDTADLVERARFPVPDGVTSVALDHDGARIATGHRDGRVALWSADGALLRVARGHDARVSALLFAPDGGSWSASWDGSIRRWAP